ncbi:MAG: SLC13 family permease [Parcubacteria group bacterium]
MVLKRRKGETSLTKRIVALVFAAIAFGVVTTLPVDLPQEQLNVLAVVVVAAILWFSEALPLFVTSLIVPVLLGLTTKLSAAQLYQPFFDPVVALFFGSFVMAAALEKHRLDQRVAAVVFRRFGSNPRYLLLGLMISVAIIGMWLSNTATVAFLLPVFLYVIRTNSLERRAPRYTKALLLGLAFATAFDGLATIIGTPPNAIAVRYLAQTGIDINFFDWMVFGVPTMLVMVPLAWLGLMAVFPPEIKRLKVNVPKLGPWSRAQKQTVAILLLVMGLWLTQPLHGLDTTAIAIMGVVALFVGGLLQPKDLARISWPTLILFGGGLVLGEAMFSTGVTDLIANGLTLLVGAQSEAIMLIGLLVFAVLLTTFGSNTAMAAILVPIVVSFAATTGAAVAPLVIGVTMALSVDVISPIGTPPNAMVHGTGHLRVSDFIRAGLLISILGIAVVFVVVSLLVH